MVNSTTNQTKDVAKTDNSTKGSGDMVVLLAYV